MEVKVSKRYSYVLQVWAATVAGQHKSWLWISEVFILIKGIDTLNFPLLSMVKSKFVIVVNYLEMACRRAKPVEV